MDTKKLAVESCLELTSDRTPILITVFIHILGKSKKPSLYSKKTDWNCFRETLNEQIALTIPLKTEINIAEAVVNITKLIQNAAWQATPDSNDQTPAEECPLIIKQKLAEKRKARKRWQLTRAPKDKQRYNKIAKELKHLLNTLKNEGIQNYLLELGPTEATDYSLWKATRKIKQPQHQIPPIRINHNIWA
jgi:phosphoglycolate phosphatase-like HAD superfamily hydrolase